MHASGHTNAGEGDVAAVADHAAVITAAKIKSDCSGAQAIHGDIATIAVDLAGKIHAYASTALSTYQDVAAVAVHLVRVTVEIHALRAADAGQGNVAARRHDVAGIGVQAIAIQALTIDDHVTKAGVDVDVIEIDAIAPILCSAVDAHATGNELRIQCDHATGIARAQAVDVDGAAAGIDVGCVQHHTRIIETCAGTVAAAANQHIAAIRRDRAVRERDTGVVAAGRARDRIRIAVHRDVPAIAGQRRIGEEDGTIPA